MTSRILPLTTICLILFLSRPIRGAVATSSRPPQPVLITGQTAPGLGDFELSSFLDSAINDLGHVVINGREEDPQVTGSGRWALYAGPVGNIRAVVREGDSLPGFPFNTGEVESIGSLAAIDPLGQVSFNARVSGPSISQYENEGLWTEVDGELQLVLKEGTSFLGVDPSVHFNTSTAGVLQSGDYRLWLAFNSNPDIPPEQRSRRTLWFSSGDTASLIALGGEVPDRSVGVSPREATYSRFARQALNASGQFVVTGTINAPIASTLINDILYTNVDGEFVALVQESDSLPSPYSGDFDEVGSANINNAGTIVFQTTLNLTEPDDAIFVYEHGEFRAVAFDGQVAPGVAQPAEFETFGSPVINATGLIAFPATTDDGQPFTDDKEGIWIERDETLELVVASDVPVPGYEDLGQFRSFDTPAMNDDGQIAFTASFGLDSRGSRSIWATDKLGNLHLIARQGQLVDVDPSPHREDWRQIHSLFFEDETGGEDGRSSGFNNRGQVVFRADFREGGAGIFLSNAAAVIPEPSGFVLAIFGIGACFGLRRSAQLS